MKPKKPTDGRPWASIVTALMNVSDQSWDPERYARNAGFVAELGLPVVELLAPQPGERILDLGCGDGALTEKLVSLGCEVVGVDASPLQIAAALRRGLDARVKDCQALDFDREFDAVFSNAALHWMKRSDDVLTGVQRALRVGGRFAGEFGGAGNVARVKASLDTCLRRRKLDANALDPWYFPTADEYAMKLRTHGFAVDSIELFERPTELPGRLADWLETFGEPFTSALPPSDRDTFRREVEEAARPHLCDGSGRWHVDYVRLRFAARLDNAASRRKP